MLLDGVFYESTGAHARSNIQCTYLLYYARVKSLNRPKILSAELYSGTEYLSQKWDMYISTVLYNTVYKEPPSIECRLYGTGQHTFEFCVKILQSPGTFFSSRKVQEERKFLFAKFLGQVRSCWPGQGKDLVRPTHVGLTRSFHEDSSEFLSWHDVQYCT